MKKYILTAVFLGLLVTLFYYPTPPTVLEQHNDNTPTEVAPESEEIVADSETATYSMQTSEVFIEEDPNSQSVVIR
ncbi:MAG: hypothetical protein AAGG75_21325 [Bacteroidota bacterium]